MYGIQRHSCVRNEEIHDVIALVCQLSAQFHYKTMVIKQASRMANELSSHERDIFAAPKPAIADKCLFISAIMAEEQV